MNQKCTKCGDEKTQGEFYRDKSTNSGFTSACKPCRNAYVKIWQMNNPAECNGKKGVKWLG